MEEYERRLKDERLVEIINEVEDSDNVDAWLDCIPELAETCVTLHEETGEVKYKEILLVIISSLESLITEAAKKASLEQKELYSVFRLKLMRIKSSFEKEH